MREEDHRPLEDPDAPPKPPTNPSRVRMFIYGCAMAAQEMEAGKTERRAMGG